MARLCNTSSLWTQECKQCQAGFPTHTLCFAVVVQVALWLVLKTADSKKQLALPLSIFGLHLFLGNWWNGGC